MSRCDVGTLATIALCVTFIIEWFRMELTVWSKGADARPSFLFMSSFVLLVPAYALSDWNC